MGGVRNMARGRRQESLGRYDPVRECLMFQSKKILGELLRVEA